MMELWWHCPFIGQLVLALKLQGGTGLVLALQLQGGRLGSLSTERFVVPGYYSCHVRHVTISHLDVIFIAHLVQAVMRWEVFREQVKKNLADVSLYMVAEG